MGISLNPSSRTFHVAVGPSNPSPSLWGSNLSPLYFRPAVRGLQTPPALDLVRFVGFILINAVSWLFGFGLTGCPEEPEAIVIGS